MARGDLFAFLQVRYGVMFLSTNDVGPVFVVLRTQSDKYLLASGQLSADQASGGSCQQLPVVIALRGPPPPLRQKHSLPSRNGDAGSHALEQCVVLFLERTMFTGPA